MLLSLLMLQTILHVFSWSSHQVTSATHISSAHGRCLRGQQERRHRVTAPAAAFRRSHLMHVLTSKRNAGYQKRHNTGSVDFVIKDCIDMRNESGIYQFKSSEPMTGNCALFLISEPNQIIAIEILHIDISCQQGGGIEIFDGWEMGPGQYFPGPEDHQLSYTERYRFLCFDEDKGYTGVKLNRRILSSQNSALVNYFTLQPGTGFTLRISFIRNTVPCNVVSKSSEGLYWMSNQGLAINCSILITHPQHLHILSMDIANIPVSFTGRRVNNTKGPINFQCEKSRDHFSMLGGVTPTAPYMTTVLTTCGYYNILGSRGAGAEMIVQCPYTVVRLVSSGSFYNSVIFQFSKPAPTEAMTQSDHLYPAEVAGEQSTEQVSGVLNDRCAINVI